MSWTETSAYPYDSEIKLQIPPHPPFPKRRKGDYPFLGFVPAPRRGCTRGMAKFKKTIIKLGHGFNSVDSRVDYAPLVAYI
jgi:hypothetical protein